LAASAVSDIVVVDDDEMIEGHQLVHLIITQRIQTFDCFVVILMIVVVVVVDDDDDDDEMVVVVG